MISQLEMHAVVNRNNDSAVQLSRLQWISILCGPDPEKKGTRYEKYLYEIPQKSLPPKENPTEPHNISLIVQ